MNETRPTVPGHPDPDAAAAQAAGSGGASPRLAGRALVAFVVVLLLTIFALQSSLHFSPHLLWLGGGAALALTISWGVAVLPAVALANLLAIGWWSGNWSASAGFAAIETGVVALCWLMMRGRWALQLPLDRLGRMVRFIVLGGVGFAAIAALSSALSTDEVRRLQRDMADGVNRMATADTHGAATRHGNPSPHQASHDSVAPGQPSASAHGDAHQSHHSSYVQAANAALGVLLMAPMIWAVILYRRRPSGSTDGAEGPGAAVAALATLLVVTALIYSGWLETTFGFRHTTMLVLPAAVWLALRHPMGYTLIGNVAVVLITDTGTDFGHGPFSDHTQGLSVLHLVYVCTTLLIATSQAERTRANAEVERLATRDALTDLPNRNLLAVRLENALATAKRRQQRLSVMFIDLDHFKRVNDTHGHDVGDKLLVAASVRIKSVLPNDSLLSRVGGDEFIAVLEGDRSPQETTAVAQHLIATLAHPFAIGRHDLHISCSVGIASHPFDGESGVDLVKHADLAMYEAKSSGRDQVRFFSAALNQEAHRRARTERALRQALAAGALELRFAPHLSSVVTGQMRGAAAQPVWRDDAGVELRGTALERLVNDVGLAEELWAWIIANVAQQVALWRDCGQTMPAPVVVRISARQLRQPERLLHELDQALRRAGLAGNELALAIPDAALQQLGPQSAETAAQLRRRGIHLVACDVGGGPTDVAQLARLAFSEWWLDAHLTRELLAGAQVRPVIEGLCGLGRTLGVEVGLSGVDHDVQYNAVAGLPATMLAGDAVGSAANAGDFARIWLRGGQPEGAKRGAQRPASAGIP